MNRMELLEIAERASPAEVARTSDLEEQAVELEAAGMVGAAKKLREGRDLKRKLAVAYEHFRFVKPDKIEAYRLRLREATRKGGGYKDLAFTTLEKYDKVPPGGVLMALKEAQKRECFDSFEVAHVVDIQDPIVFGRVKGCADRFFVAQWDDDVRIEDILKASEG